MNMMDVGVTMKNTSGPVPTSPDSTKKEKKIYPRLNLDAAPPELLGKKVGEVCRLSVTAKVVGISQRDDQDGQHNDIQLEIQQVGYAGTGTKTKDEYLGMSAEERAAHDKSQVMDSEDQADSGAANEPSEGE